MKNLFGRKFSAEEDKVRFELFKKSVEAVDKKNAEKDEATPAYGINDLADRTLEEKQELEKAVTIAPAV